MKWEHKSKREKTWTEYPPDHNMQLSQARQSCVSRSTIFIWSCCTYLTSLTQAFRDKERVVILDHEGKKWRVDLDKMEQKPVVQPFLQIKRRQVRYLNLGIHLSWSIPPMIRQDHLINLKYIFTMFDRLDTSFYVTIINIMPYMNIITCGLSD